MSAPAAVLAQRPEAPEPPRPAGPLARAAAAAPPPGLLMVSIVSVQLGSALAIQLLPALGAVATAFLRVGLSALLLLLGARRSIRRSARRHAGSLLLFGAILGGMNLCFYGAIARIPLGIAVAVEFIGPLALAAAGSRRARDFACIALAAAGVALLTPDLGHDLDPVGLGLAGLAGAGWAGFVVMSRRVGRLLPGGSGLALAMVAAAAVLLPPACVVGGLGALDPGLMAGALAVAILSTTVPLSLEFEALKRMTPRGYGVLVTLEPAVAALVGAAVLGQALAPRAILAVACVTAAALGVTVGDRNATSG
ncbi:MAG: EamA family transporter [Rhodospirillaceae bacterium]|nr:EamA family transporter [Rhodospirillaceae bacterium]